MDVGDIINLLKQAKVSEALNAIDLVDDKIAMADALCEFAASLNHIVGKEDLCISLLKQALLLDLKNSRIHYNLGIIFSSPKMILDDEKNIERAKKAYTKAYELDNNFLEARYNLGILAFLLGEFELAKKCKMKLKN